MLLTVIKNGLHPQAKFLYTLLHAYADASGVAVVEEAHIAGIMRISPGRLRAYRSMLNNSGSPSAGCVRPACGPTARAG